MDRRFHPVTLLAATQASPTLAKLTQLSQDSVARLKALQPLIPPALRPCLVAGPIEDTVWCLIVKGNAAAAKIRQILPDLVLHLKHSGHDVTAIRIKVQSTEAKT
jgi:hypothetical protein